MEEWDLLAQENNSKKNLIVDTINIKESGDDPNTSTKESNSKSIPIRIDNIRREAFIAPMIFLKDYFIQNFDYNVDTSVYLFFC